MRYKDGKCSCGRYLTLIKSIEGREQELIITKKGNLISMTAMNMHSDVFDNVKQFQFYQDTPGKVIFKVVKKNNYSDEDTMYILQELQKKMKNQVDIEIKFVNEISRTKRGKYKFLIQKLYMDPLNKKIS